MRRRFWRGVLAGAVIGLVEAAGLDRPRRILRRPLRVVWIDDREPDDPLDGAGVWFMDPVGDPRPAPGDLRRPTAGRLRIARLHPARILRSLGGSRS